MATKKPVNQEAEVVEQTTNEVPFLQAQIQELKGQILLSKNLLEEAHRKEKELVNQRNLLTQEVFDKQKEIQKQTQEFQKEIQRLKGEEQKQIQTFQNELSAKENEIILLNKKIEEVLKTQSEESVIVEKAKSAELAATAKQKQVEVELGAKNKQLEQLTLKFNELAKLFDEHLKGFDDIIELEKVLVRNSLRTQELLQIKIKAFNGEGDKK